MMALGRGGVDMLETVRERDTRFLKCALMCCQSQRAAETGKAPYDVFIRSSCCVD